MLLNGSFVIAPRALWPIRQWGGALWQLKRAAPHAPPRAPLRPAPLRRSQGRLVTQFLAAGDTRNVGRTGVADLAESATWAGGGVLQRDGKIVRLRARTKGAGRCAGAVFGRPTFSRRTADARGAATPFAREQHAGLLGGRSGDFDAPRLVVDVCSAVDAAGAVRVRSRGE